MSIIYLDKGTFYFYCLLIERVEIPEGRLGGTLK